MSVKVVVISMLVNGTTSQANRIAEEIAAKIEAETPARTVCVDSVYEKRRIV